MVDVQKESGGMKMRQTVGKWGNSLAIRLPGDISPFQKGEAVDVVPRGEGVIIMPIKRRRSMKELLAGEKKFHGELADFGPAVGDEADI
jgi:antitoxin component of MazEF toxin-antitoxin module